MTAERPRPLPPRKVDPNGSAARTEALRRLENEIAVHEGIVRRRETMEDGRHRFLLTDVKVRRHDTSRPTTSVPYVEIDHVWLDVDETSKSLSPGKRAVGLGRIGWYARANGSVGLTVDAALGDDLTMLSKGYGDWRAMGAHDRRRNRRHLLEQALAMKSRNQLWLYSSEISLDDALRHMEYLVGLDKISTDKEIAAAWRGSGAVGRPVFDIDGPLPRRGRRLAVPRAAGFA